MYSSIVLTLAACLPHESSSTAPPDWVIPSGTEEVYDTGAGPLILNSLIIEQAGMLRVVGEQPFRLLVSRTIIVNGTLDLSGDDSFGVTTLNTTNIPETGAAGQSGGGQGGMGSGRVVESTPAGGPGFDMSGAPLGGGGGETSYSAMGTNARRGAGGGGGALGPNRPVSAGASDPANLGLIATRGWPGGAMGLGAVSQSQRAQGGHAGTIPFVDNDPTNDFWGTKVTGTGVIVGELPRPLAGRGGGAGGDAVDSASFPLVPFSPTGDEKGAGGGGGGGLGAILTRNFRMGSEGRILADGGDGGGGENTLFFDRVGGGSGGGSGGMLVIESLVFDLTQAGDDTITAKGGRGGFGAQNVHDTVGAGGNGGPGIIQLHAPAGDPGAISLPAGKTLDDLTGPDAHVLAPILGG